ncbi:MAG: hypothetical protein CUN52_00480 [Phototrophicales bacterium]|nr:MAG: hypothetical protein CUN52_00480 [Phototrophicales bacterium]
MNRNLRSELLTAIFVIMGIIIAIGAVIALSAPEVGRIETSPTTISMVESPTDNRSTATMFGGTAQVIPNTAISSPIQVSTSLTFTPFADTTDTPTHISRITNTPISITPTARPSNTLISSTNTPIPTIPPTDIVISATVTARPTRIPTDTRIPPTQTSQPTNTPIIPTITPMPTNTSMPTQVAIPTPITNLVAEGCLNPSVQIISPRPNERLNAPFDIIGTATLPNFGLYRIEIRPDNALTYQRVVATQQVVYADVLARLNPSDYPNGVYWIRLVVLANRGIIAENGTCAIPTIFE